MGKVLQCALIAFLAIANIFAVLAEKFPFDSISYFFYFKLIEAP